MGLPHIYILTLLKDTEHRKAGEVYIGQHNGSNKKYFTGGKIPKRIIKKYGPDIFRKEIIVEDSFSRDELDFMEKFYIRVYGANRPGKGLNIEGGGRKGSRVEDSEVYQYNSDGELINEYHSVWYAAKQLRVQERYLRELLRKDLDVYNGPLRVSKTRLDSVRRMGYKLNLHAFTRDGDYFRYFEFLDDLSSMVGTKAYGPNIFPKVDKKHKMAYGFQWRSEYSPTCDPYVCPINNHKKKEVKVRYVDTGKTEVFDSVTKAAASLGIPLGTLEQILKRGYNSGKYPRYDFGWDKNSAHTPRYLDNKNIKGIVVENSTGDCMVLSSISEVAEFLEIDSSIVSRVCQRGKGTIRKEYKVYYNKI